MIRLGGGHIGGLDGRHLGPRLVAWFASHQRALPWRSVRRDPYRVWISEVMLQQTRVETVLRYYEPFLAKFPTVEALAAAREDDLMKAWEGLGYYRRARLLQQGARHVVERGLPECYHEWIEVPGVGPYTAGAIASLVDGERVAAVDGNVLRVWARVTASRDDISTPVAKRKAEAWVLAHQPRASPGAFNEALMELGATVCTPGGAPSCGACPIARACAGKARAGGLPRKRAKAAPREVDIALAVVRREGKLLLERRGSGLLAGTWGLPWVEGGAAELGERVASLVGGKVELRGPVAEATHAFTHRRWSMRAYEVATRARGGEWRAPEDVALGTAHRKILRLLVEP